MARKRALALLLLVFLAGCRPAKAAEIPTQAPDPAVTLAPTPAPTTTVTEWWYNPDTGITCWWVNQGPGQPWKVQCNAEVPNECDSCFYPDPDK